MRGARLLFLALVHAPAKPSTKRERAMADVHQISVALEPELLEAIRQAVESGD